MEFLLVILVIHLTCKIKTDIIYLANSFLKWFFFLYIVINSVYKWKCRKTIAEEEKQSESLNNIVIIDIIYIYIYIYIYTHTPKKEKGGRNWKRGDMRMYVKIKGSWRNVYKI